MPEHDQRNANRLAFEGAAMLIALNGFLVWQTVFS